MTTPIYIHPSPQTSLVPLLSTHLPFSGPLLKRIQSNLLFDSSETACFLATFPPDCRNYPSETLPNHPPPQIPWLAAYVDIYRGKETQVWIYSSSEYQASSSSSLLPTGLGSGNEHVPLSSSDNIIEKTRAQLLALILFIRTEMIPAYLTWISDAEQQSHTAVSPQKASASEGGTNGTVLHKQIPAHPPTSVLIGTLHTGLLALLRDLASTADDTNNGKNPTGGDNGPYIRILRGEDTPYAKYLFPSSVLVEGGRGQLPRGYRFHDRSGKTGVLPHQVDLIISRTHIPRSREWCARMPSAALYYDDGDDDYRDSTTSTEITETTEDWKDLGKEEMPIAWAFLGNDGSLSTLHVEPEHRGKGLASLVGKEVMSTGMAKGGPFASSQLHVSEQNMNGWACTDVALDNVASRRVMQKMGGKPQWTVVWVVVEVIRGFHGN